MVHLQKIFLWAGAPPGDYALATQARRRADLSRAAARPFISTLDTAARLCYMGCTTLLFGANVSDRASAQGTRRGAVAPSPCALGPRAGCPQLRRAARQGECERGGAHAPAGRPARRGGRASYVERGRGQRGRPTQPARGARRPPSAAIQWRAYLDGVRGRSASKTPGDGEGAGRPRRAVPRSRRCPNRLHHPAASATA